MGTSRTLGSKTVEWVRRYLPNEIAGWVGELGGAWVTYALTGSFAAAVVVGTIGASVGYYATAYVNGVRWSFSEQTGRTRPMRIVVANLLATRSILVEFGPAEAIDSLVIRPVLLYSFPFLLGNVAVGWVVGSILADVAFYVMAIFSYERFRRLLVVGANADGPTDLLAASTVP
ncbi:MAG: hypothetical protein ABW001_10130 [Mycobacterium sp.]